MPIPDHIIFGPAEGNGILNYSQVREFSEENQLAALKCRLGGLFVKQVAELAKRNEEGKTVIYSPFPLFLMTCVGIETAGKVFFFRSPNEDEKAEDVQRAGFLTVCNKLDSKFSRPLSSTQKDEHNLLWGKDAHKRVTSISHVIHRFGRNTMIHGYQGKGVFLDQNIQKWDWVSGAVHLNPYWFWEAFVQAHSDLWAKLHANKEPTNPLRKSAITYLRELLA